MKQHIYADNAATTRLDKAAFEAMVPWLAEEYGNPSTLYSLARKPRHAISAARESIAKAIGAQPNEIFFTACGTESDNWAVKGAAFQRKSGRVITSCIEHHAVLNTCAFLERMGYNIVMIFQQGVEFTLQSSTHILMGEPYAEVTLIK